MAINTIDGLSFVNDSHSKPTDLEVNYNSGSSTPPLAVTAGNIQFYTPSTSPVSYRTVDDRLKEYVSVKDYGAKGDGVTDDTAAIQAAFNATNAAGTSGIVFFPIGNYQIKTPDVYVNLPANAEAFGCGVGSVISISNNGTYPTSNIGGFVSTVAQADTVTFRNLNFVISNSSVALL